MFVEIIIALLCGVLCGIFTGLIPGVHVNLIAVLLISLSVYLLEYVSAFALAVFIFSMALTHTFLDVIPSIFLGAPNEDTAMAVLPGHKLLLEGIGYEAVRLATIGSLMSLFLGILLLPLLIVVVPYLYNLLNSLIGWLLLFVAVFMILIEERKIVIFLFSGMLGVIVFSLHLSQPLFPLLSGMFGVSTLLLALNGGAVLPIQYITQNIRLPFIDYFWGVLAAVFSGWITSLLPGLGSAQAAVLAGTFFKNITGYLYIVVVGGINTVNFLLSLVTFYTIDKARNGGVVAIKQLLESISFSEVMVLFIVALIVAGSATILTFFIGKRFVTVLGYFNYESVCCCVILFIIILTFFFSGWIGLFVLVVSTAIGILPPIVQVYYFLLLGIFCFKKLVYDFYILYQQLFLFQLGLYFQLLHASGFLLQQQLNPDLYTYQLLIYANRIFSILLPFVAGQYSSNRSFSPQSKS